MWQNKNTNTNNNYRGSSGDPPHRSDLCEACRLGQCINSRHY